MFNSISIKNAFFIYLFSLFFLIQNSFANNETLNFVFASSMPDITQSKNGNFAELSTLLKQKKQKNPNTIFLFGGNSLGPSPMSSLDKGAHIIDILNSLEPDVMGVNKREFSFFEDELSLRSYEAAFPFVLSNIYDQLTNDNIDGLNSSILIKRASYKIGIVSIIEKDVVEEYATKRVKIKNIKNSILKQTKILKEQGANLIVLMSSNIFEQTDKLLDDGIIDLAFSKNDYFNLIKQNLLPKHKRNILITKRDDISIIKLNLDTKTNTITSFEKKFISLNSLKKDPIVLKQITSYTNRLNQLLDEKIGILKTPMNSLRDKVRGGENALGNLLADAIKEYTHAQLSIINGGTIRGETIYTKNHQISRRDIAKELPYRNKIVLLKLSGEEIIDALENGFSKVDKLLGRFPHVSGMKVSYNASLPINRRVKNVLINNSPIIKNKIYKLATTTYLASGGDGYSIFKGKEFLKYPNPSHRLITDVLVEYIIRKREISPKIEGRLEEIK